jgi:hypothetical protein
MAEEWNPGERNVVREANAEVPWTLRFYTILHEWRRTEGEAWAKPGELPRL